MIVVPGPVEFVMGSPETESDRKTDEIQQRMRINRTFAISSHLVTKEQFLRFRRDFDNKEMHRFPDPSSPIAGMTWHEAAEYCNWLSRQEGIEEAQLCYQIEDGHVIRLKDNYLRLTSYRLPTEAEIEYVTRAGSATSRFYGETDELLVHYAWYIANSKDMPHRVGTKKPNDLGIFDAHGNLWTWCQNGLQASQRRTSPKTLDDLEEDVLAQTTRGLRGGSYIALPSSLRSATCNQIEPSSRFIRYGIRIARTISAPEATKTASKDMP
jgi:formylglycine-generating enzyme required for sulfatase activity